MPGFGGSVSAPSQLTQLALPAFGALALGSLVQPTYQGWTGLSDPKLLLRARSGGLTGYTGSWQVPVQVRFEAHRLVTIPGNPATHRLLTASWTSPTVAPGTSVDWCPLALPGGNYVWSASTLVLGRTSAAATLSSSGAFVVKNTIPEPVAVAPVKPIEARAAAVAGLVNTLEISAKGWDVNADDVRFEFQSRPFGSTVAYTTQRSSWFAIPTGETDLRRTGRVQVPVTGKIEWRVRVEDETGNLGPWTYGSSN